MPIYKTVRGFFGSTSIVPSRVTGVAPDGSRVKQRRVTVYLTRVGINQGTKRAEGILDTDHQPEETIDSAKHHWGDQWKKKLEEAVAALAPRLGMVLVSSKDEFDELKETAGFPSDAKVIQHTRTVSNRKPRREPGRRIRKSVPTTEPSE